MNCGAKVFDVGWALALEFALVLPLDAPRSADMDWFRPCPGGGGAESGDAISADLGLEFPLGDPDDGDGVFLANGFPRKFDAVEAAIVVQFDAVPAERLMTHPTVVIGEADSAPKQ